MDGLEKITAQILSEAKAKADKKIAEANKTAEGIITAAEAEAASRVLDIQKRSEADAENLKARVVSSNDLYRRTQALTVRQEVISQVIDKAYDHLCNLEPAAYFDMLTGMIEKNAMKKDGIICFSDKDLKAMPADYEQKIQAAAAKAGGTLSLSKEGKDIDNGFILIYDGIEENCTLQAIFDARREEMQDTVYELLYRKEA